MRLGHSQVYLLHHPAWHKPFYVIDINSVCVSYLDAARTQEDSFN